MSKKPQFWEKLKKNYHIRGETANHDVIHNRIKGRKKDLDVINSCSETSLPFQNSCSRLQNCSHREKVKCKKDYICDACDNVTRNKHTSPKTEKDYDNSTSDKTRLNLEYIDNLVGKIKELKNRVKYFENQCECETVIDDNSLTYQRQRENKQIGDYDAPSLRKLHKNQSDSRYNHGDNSSNFAWIDNYKTPFHHKISSYVKNVSDHQKSIYTANGHMIPDVHFKVSKNQKNRSNVSIIMSLHSTSKNNFVKVNPLPDSKNFQAAAEEFIEQAEELKSKIGYILQCCGYNRVSSVSDPSESVVPSDCNYSSKSGSRELVDDVISDRDLKYLFGAVSSQYSEILTSLVSIEKQIKTLNKHKVPKPLSKASSKGSMDVPKTTGNSNNKVNTHSRSRMSGTAMIRNYLAEDTKLPRTLTKKQHSAETKTSQLRTRKNSRVERNLEPVVMVYEPILPECDITNGIGICKYCGQELNSCAGCSEDSKTKLRKGTCKNKKDDEKTQKYGFVVTYTPDISLDLNVTPSTSKASTKTKVKEKKKIIPCLWF